MCWKQYVPPKRHTFNKELSKTVVIVIFATAIVILLGVILNLKRAYSLREYSIAHNCEWIYQNTNYGDDRDYICK